MAGMGAHTGTSTLQGVPASPSGPYSWEWLHLHFLQQAHPLGMQPSRCIAGTLCEGHSTGVLEQKDQLLSPGLKHPPRPESSLYFARKHWTPLYRGKHVRPWDQCQRGRGGCCWHLQGLWIGQRTPVITQYIPMAPARWYRKLSKFTETIKSMHEMI